MRAAIRDAHLVHAIEFLLPLSFIVTAYDRYRPLNKARFAGGPMRPPAWEGSRAMTWTAIGLGPVDGAAFVPVTVGGQSLVVLRLENGWAAAEDRCAHAGCPLSTDGRLEDGRLVCDCHGSEFDPRTGTVLRGPAVRPVAVYAVREGPDGGLEVDL